MKIFVISAHPDPGSFGSRLADAYVEAAQALHEVRRQNLFDLDFDPVLREGLRRVQPLEPDLITVQANLNWAQHVVVFYPVWWGNVPAVLKGMFDRALNSEFTNHREADDPAWRKVLTGRSAHIITTSDAAATWLRKHYRDADTNAVRYATFERCGMQPVRITRVGGVRSLSQKQRDKWVTRVSLFPRHELRPDEK
jgi:putative NADPH-quinone reductase